MMIEIPPKYAVVSIVGYIKGISSIAIAQKYTGWKQNFTGQSFWTKGYFASTVGLNEENI
jgi:putative transposase